MPDTHDQNRTSSEQPPPAASTPPDTLPASDQIDLDDLSESEWRALVARSFAEGAARMDTTDQLIADNTALTKAVWQGTAEIRDIVVTGKAFFSGLNKFAHGCARVWRYLKPVIQAATVIAGAWVAIRGAMGTAAHGHGPAK